MHTLVKKETVDGNIISTRNTAKNNVVKKINFILICHVYLTETNLII